VKTKDGVSKQITVSTIKQTDLVREKSNRRL